MTFRAEWDEYPDIPDIDGAQVDPYWLQLQRGTGLPTSYMPSSVPGGQHRPWQRATALVLLVLLLTATASGICLTYGPGELFHYLNG